MCAKKIAGRERDATLLLGAAILFPIWAPVLLVVLVVLIVHASVFEKRRNTQRD